MGASLSVLFGAGSMSAGQEGRGFAATADQAIGGVEWRAIGEAPGAFVGPPSATLQVPPESFHRGSPRSAASPASPDSVEGRPDVLLPDVPAIEVPRAPAGSRVVVLGDSYASGWKGTGRGTQNWTSVVGRARGWSVTNLAVAGTGFLNPGWTNQPLGSRVARVVRERPDVVVIAAGHNDSRWSAAATSKAADEVIRRIHARLPDTVIVVVGPIWQDGSPPSRCLALRDHLRRTAARVGAVFIDPIAERWFAGPNNRFVGSDGIHPTNAGHRHIADRVLADLAASLAT